jgi:hypothetical protein
VIAALLNIADSRFQEQLLARAKAAGKIRADYRIPDACRNNLPERLERALAPHRSRGLFSEFPFGTDLTAEEVTLAHALKFLEAHTATRAGRVATVATALLRGRPAARHAAALTRMDLAAPRSLAERFTQRLLVVALDATAPRGVG